MNLEAQIVTAAQTGAARAVEGVVQQVAAQLGLLIIRPEDDTVLTLEGAAAWLLVDVDTLRAQVRSGAIPAAKVGTQWRIHKAALRRFLDPNLTRFVPLEHAAD